MKGQLFSMDFLFAISLILFLLATAMFVSEKAAITINESESNRDLEKGAASAASMLIQTSGQPSNWDQLPPSDASIKSLGFASSRNVLDPQKVEYFFNTANSDFANYTLFKRILGLDFPSGNYSVSMTDEDNGVLFAMPISPSDKSSIVAIQRQALLNGKNVRLKLMVWVEK